MLRLWCPPSAFLIFLILPALISLPARAATFTVTNLNDSGPGSLRQAIVDANAAIGDDSINFDSQLNGGTITLTSGNMVITDNLQINGPDPTILTISGNNRSRIFDIQNGTVIIYGLTIKNGRPLQTEGPVGGGIINNGVLSINNCILSNNFADNRGGAIANSVTLNVKNSIISGNSASFVGGGIYNIANRVVHK